MRTLILAALMLALFGLGCSDDSESKKDSSVVSDSASQQDGGQQQDSTVNQSEQGAAQMDIGLILLDSGDAPWTCAQIAECEKGCGSDTNCLGGCASRGCEAAKTAIEALTQCAIEKCIASCVGGFDDTCNACTAEQCPEIYANCTSNTCD